MYKRQVVKYVKTQYPEQNQSFKVFTRRVNKRYPMESMEVSASLGERILDARFAEKQQQYETDISLVHRWFRGDALRISQVQMCIRDRVKRAAAGCAHHCGSRRFHAGPGNLPGD